MIFNFKKNMVEAADEIRNAIGSVRHKLPIEMREPMLQRIDPGRSRSCSWRSRAPSRRTPRSRAWPKTSSPTGSAASTAWRWST